LSQHPKPTPFYRMSALRQAVLLTIVFIVVMLAAGTLALKVLQREFESRVEAELSVRFNNIADEIANDGFDGDLVSDNGLETLRFLPNGQSSAIREFRRNGYFDEIDMHGARHDRGDWMYLGGPVEGGRLIVGTNLGRQEVFYEVALQSLAFVGLISALIAGVFGLVFGIRSQKRISAISSTLNRVAGGDLTARVNARRNSDDLDALAHRVDDTTVRLDALLRQARDFSANIAHDLKTPLARLRIRLETALLAENDHGDSEAQISAALEQTDKVIGIFDAFLRIAKLESGTTKASFASVDLVEIAREVIDIYGPVVEDSNRTLTAQFEPPAIVHGDRVLLIQMLANLIENALRHTPEGTDLRLIARPGELGLADNGPGIPADQREKVTQPLYRLEKSRTTEGAGLGLSLVKTIAELHGATLILSPDPDSGRGLYIRANFAKNRNITNL
jgi:signal transduction histidine kinase